MVETAIRRLKEKEVEYKEFQSMSGICSMRVGGPARLLVLPKTEQELVFSVLLLSEHNISYKIIGRMSNILPDDGLYNGALIKCDKLNDFYLRENIVKAGVGLSLPALSLRLAALGLSGAEELSGIPGSLGGAVFGNAGAYGRSVSDALLGVRAFSPNDGEIVYLNRGDLSFSYRNSSFKGTNLVLLSCDLSFKEVERFVILKRMSELREKRRAYQPTEPSLGSVYKRPNGDYASRLIDASGLKGTSIGGAKVSTKHAGFIINVGTATSGDVRSLCRLIEETVLKRFQVSLEREIEFLE